MNAAVRVAWQEESPALGTMARLPAGVEFLGKGRMVVTEIYSLMFEVSSASTLARLGGEIDMATAPTVGARLTSEIDRGTVVLDMTDVEFIDSAGIRMLVEVGRLAEDGGGPLAIVAPKDSVVRRMIEMTGIDRLFVIHDTLPAAS